MPKFKLLTCFVSVAVGSALSSTGSVISKGASIEEVQLSIAQDNKDRCEFFKHFRYDLSDKIGDVSNQPIKKLLLNETTSLT